MSIGSRLAPTSLRVRPAAAPADGVLALHEAPEPQGTTRSGLHRRTEFDEEEHLHGTVQVSAKQD
jgi:hypothetical protein